MQSVTQIKVGKHKTGIVGFDEALEEAARDSQVGSDQKVAAAMIKKLSKKNYMPLEAYDEYEKAFVREYKKFIGEPIADDLEHVRDMKEIASYGVMGSPALVINRKIKSVGSVPSKSKLKEYISQAAFELKNQQGVC